MTIRAGQLRERIRIEREAPARDASGDVIPTWQLVAEVSAGIKRLSGTEAFESQRRTGRVQTRFIIRRRDDLDASMRIVRNGKIYNITSAMQEDLDGTVILADEQLQGA